MRVVQRGSGDGLRWIRWASQVVALGLLIAVGADLVKITQTPPEPTERIPAWSLNEVPLLSQDPGSQRPRTRPATNQFPADFPPDPVAMAPQSEPSAPPAGRPGSVTIPIFQADPTPAAAAPPVASSSPQPATTPLVTNSAPAQPSAPAPAKPAQPATTASTASTTGGPPAKVKMGTMDTSTDVPASGSGTLGTVQGSKVRGDRNAGLGTMDTGPVKSEVPGMGSLALSPGGAGRNADGSEVKGGGAGGASGWMYHDERTGTNTWVVFVGGGIPKANVGVSVNGVPVAEAKVNGSRVIYIGPAANPGLMNRGGGGRR